MNVIKLIAVTLSLSVMYGCATPKMSDARQIAMYGGITDIRDSKVEGTTETALSSSKTYQTAFNSMGTGVVTGSGLGADSLGIGLAMSMLSPRSDAARHSMFGWIPENAIGEYSNSLEFLHSESRKSAEKATEKLGFTVQKAIDAKKNEDMFATQLTTAYLLENPEVGCPQFDPNVKNDGQYCYFGIKTYKDLDEDAIDESDKLTRFSVENKNVYKFSAGQPYHYSRPYINRPKTATFNDLDLYQEFSKSLPDYVFVYIAPRAASLSQSEKLPFPVLFRSGEPMFFVVSDTK